MSLINAQLYSQSVSRIAAQNPHPPSCFVATFAYQPRRVEFRISLLSPTALTHSNDMSILHRTNDKHDTHMQYRQRSDASVTYRLIGKTSGTTREKKLATTSKVCGVRASYDIVVNLNPFGTASLLIYCTFNLHHLSTYREWS